MSFWDAYLASLKSPEVEEPIDYWVHRPLGYVVAKLSDPTPLTPDLITVGSILLGWAAGYALFQREFVLGGLLILASTVFDCADGQLARMRRTSSVFGRALDGTADTLVLLAVIPATVYHLWLRYHEPVWLGVAGVVFAVLTVATSAPHTVVYDYYKNVWLRFTSDGYKEGEPYSAAKARHDEVRDQVSWLERTITLPMYLLHVKSQEDYLKNYDPFISMETLPSRTPEREAIYRCYAARPWALCRTLFGTGSLMFQFALFNAIQLPEAFLAFRFVVLNAIFFWVLRPKMRRASKRAMAAMAAST